MADLLAVIKGTMGGRDYYIGKMNFQELASKVQFFTDLDQDRNLDTLLQRQLGGRAAAMTEYLLRQSERFYGAIIVAAWGGKPEYMRVKMEDHPLLDDDFEFGLLKFDGKQAYFALDGQHRLRSIKDAIEKDGALRNEEVSVIFVTHERTEEGNVKTRRLFHTLNRHARPTTPGENIALDEDNVVSICTRMLLRSGMRALSPGLIKLEHQNVGKADTDKFTTLAALYHFNRSVLDALYHFQKDYLRFRPDASDVEAVYSAISSLWMELRDRVKELGAVETNKRTPGEIREPGGDAAKGHLLFRPLGLRIYGEVIGKAVTMGQSGRPVGIGAELEPGVWREALDRVGALPLIVGSAPWRGTVFRNDKMETGARKLAVKLALYMLDLDDMDEETLLREYRGHLEDDDVALPKRVV